MTVIWTHVRCIICGCHLPAVFEFKQGRTDMNESVTGREPSSAVMGKVTCDVKSEPLCDITFPSDTTIKAELAEHGVGREPGVCTQEVSLVASLENQAHKNGAHIPGRTHMNESATGREPSSAVMGKVTCDVKSEPPCDITFPSDTTIKTERVQDKVRSYVGGLIDSVLSYRKNKAAESSTHTSGSSVTAVIPANFTKNIVGIEENKGPKLVPSEKEFMNCYEQGVMKLNYIKAPSAQTSQTSTHSNSQDDAQKPATTIPEASSLPKEIFESNNVVELLNRNQFLQEVLDVYVCSFCGRRFARYCRLRQHLIIHSRERNFKCDKCGAAFKVNSTLQSHLLTHSMDKPFKCDKCPSTQCTQSALLRHKQNRHGVGADGYVCYICGEMLKTSNGLEYHIQHHTGKNVLCVACGKLFYTVSHLKKHTARHHDPTPKEPGENFECLHCSRKYATKASLRNHIMIVHLKEMPYECEECGLKFTLRYRLNRHVACHKQRKFWCDCNQSFVTKGGLNRHKMTHVNFRPYVCDMCGLTFTQKGSVLRHIVTSMRGRYFKRTGTCRPVTRGRGGYYVRHKQS
ncbi:zinc finger protein 26-like isoform X3 [Bacillus rossius redtenbacheri]|uniref:zinc finger protein 26-like isoform X3 n=1 Tax=Bacillus rossius redtenbacheri TaxID=93214 RepID=UPI002FDE42A3